MSMKTCPFLYSASCYMNYNRQNLVGCARVPILFCPGKSCSFSYSNKSRGGEVLINPPYNLFLFSLSYSNFIYLFPFLLLSLKRYLIKIRWFTIYILLGLDTVWQGPRRGQGGYAPSPWMFSGGHLTTPRWGCSVCPKYNLTYVIFKL